LSCFFWQDLAGARSEDSITILKKSYFKSLFKSPELIFDFYDMLYIPICTGAHWILAELEINQNKKTANIYDSLYG
jgi:hypothetical protein